MVKGDGNQSRVFFKGSENDFVIFLDDVNKYKAWKNDSSVPLVDVVQSFDVFTTGCVPRRASTWKIYSPAS